MVYHLDVLSRARIHTYTQIHTHTDGLKYFPEVCLDPAIKPGSAGGAFEDIKSTKVNTTYHYEARIIRFRILIIDYISRIIHTVR